MRHSEYEKRRRALEKQYDEDRDLLRAAHEAKLRSLETLWLASPPTEAAAATEPVPSYGGDPRREEPESENPAANETQARSETQTTNETQTTSETQEDVRLPRGGLRDAIEDALPRLPEIFDRQELERALGFTSRRSSLVRILKELWAEKTLEIVEFSEGRRPTKYRKVAGPD
jgi:hypothetical protein